MLLKKQLLEGIEDVEKVLEYDLNFYDTQNTAVIGLNQEFITSARLDNLLSCYVGLVVLLNTVNITSASTVLMCNDHEEVGSQSAIGAKGQMLTSILKRICGSSEQLSQVMARSTMISTDNAHGIHPNFSDRNDENHGPLLNHGTVIKINANQDYATNDVTSSMFRLLCQLENVEYQYVVQNNIGCSSTIGPITAGKLGVKTLDIGLPTFGMHSIRETCGAKDAFELSRILMRFYSINQLP